jgi:hypothetical protein
MLQPLVLRFWVFVFIAKNDPMLVIELGFESIPALLLFTPLSFYVTNLVTR